MIALTGVIAATSRFVVVAPRAALLALGQLVAPAGARRWGTLHGISATVNSRSRSFSRARCCSSSWSFIRCEPSSALEDVGGIESVRYRWLEATIEAPPATAISAIMKGIKPMASLFRRAKDFAQSPKGKQVTEEIKEQASKPENRRKLTGFGQRYMKKR